MNTYPADEQRISDVERGRSCGAVVPFPPGGSLAAGDTVLFALSQSRAGRPPCYVMGGDSVLVLLTGVTDLGTNDPITGQALFQLSWEPLGQNVPPVAATKRAVKSQYHPRTSLTGHALRPGRAPAGPRVSIPAPDPGAPADPH